VPDRVGGSPLSLKQPRFPGTVSGGKEEGDKIKKLATHKQIGCNPSSYAWIKHFPAWVSGQQARLSIRGLAVQSPP